MRRCMQKCRSAEAHCMPQPSGDCFCGLDSILAAFATGAWCGVNVTPATWPFPGRHGDGAKGTATDPAADSQCKSLSFGDGVVHMHCPFLEVRHWHSESVPVMCIALACVQCCSIHGTHDHILTQGCKPTGFKLLDSPLDVCDLPGPLDAVGFTL